MQSDLWAFFDATPAGGFEIESSLCTGDQCNKYEGNIKPDNIWTFYLTSADGKVTKEVKTSISDFLKPTIRFSMEDQDEKISLEVSPEDCKVTEDKSCLYISKIHKDRTVTIAIKAAKA